ncbi:sulfate ABC transporter permease subunit CysT [Pleomorphomonas diazotrophica]|uniref:Sulfate transport system permease protein CysT n=1 Tax=Pleomorphomonas diazotrophica TaxID=1166257 RepID=A0A1I4T8W2_9HYPH|nr:sulfate ABC transporter permease subunit CysT [Pleomorphomonas diazotrophica]PKR89484.1 sulfate ABC transporter permease subunit CysT [Pleomorphomonas diazotrophica]SFM73116.1 sulfate transport system permease protein [Pleomorphomonas diazotrophica]
MILNAPFVKPSVLPGFRLTIAFTILYLTAIVLLPLGALLFRASSLGVHEIVALALDGRTLSALKLSFVTSFAAAAFNVPFGLLIAWVLVRYDFPGRRFFDAIIDLPFALPTAVAGIALTALYAPKGWIGSVAGLFGLKIAFTPIGVFLALVFVGLPFIVRTVQPVLAEVDRELEEAAATLGAGRLRTIASVVLPVLSPAILTGFALAFARAVGEYGSVIFIAGNIPYVSEIAPLLIVIKLEEFDYAGATAVAAIMLLVSFGTLLLINLIQARARARYGHV